MRHERILLVGCCWCGIWCHQWSLGFSWQPTAANLVLPTHGAAAFVNHYHHYATARRTTALPSLKWNNWVEDQAREERKQIRDQPYVRVLSKQVLPLTKAPFTMLALGSFIVHDVWGSSSHHSSLTVHAFSSPSSWSMFLNLMGIGMVVWVYLLFGAILDSLLAIPVQLVALVCLQFLDTFILLPGQWMVRSLAKTRSRDRILARYRIDPQLLRDEQDCHEAIQRMMSQQKAQYGQQKESKVPSSSSSLEALYEREQRIEQEIGKSANL